MGERVERVRNRLRRVRGEGREMRVDIVRRWGEVCEALDERRGEEVGGERRQGREEVRDKVREVMRWEGGRA